MKKPTNRFFNSAAKGNTLTLSFYDAIGADFFGDGITATMVQEALNQADYTDITVRLNSPGGNAFEGVSIYNLLHSCGKPVNVVVDGLAASAASIIAMAGDTITMNDGSMLMIHEAQAIAMGDAAEMLKMADTLKAVTGSIADIYVSRTKTDKPEVLALMAAETWMDANDAVSKGFATATTKSSAVKNSFDLGVFKNTPEVLKNTAPSCECECPQCTDGTCEDCSCDECECDNCECKVPGVTDETGSENATPDKISMFSKQLEINKRK